ncbi:MAG: FHA domain-containing protein [Polyangiaceae bacterium]|nr:FHA domain-containing protein [Polyangiaceae bacterium]
MAQGIAVRVFNTTDQSATDYTLRRLPVRIGRNQLNDLVLEYPFVSQFHAVLELGDRGLRLCDLGSTNGTTLRSTGRMVANQRVDLVDHQYEFAIVALVLRVWAVTLPDGAPAPTSARRPLGVSTLFGGGAKPTGQAGADAFQALSQGLIGHYANYRAGWVQFLRALEAGIQAYPPQVRAALVQQAVQSFPEAALEPEFRSLAAGFGVMPDQPGAMSMDSVALQALRELAADFLPDRPPPASPQDAAAFAARLQSTLDVFIRCFLPLRDGYRQFESEMAIRNSMNPPLGDPWRASVNSAKDAKELSRLLLDWRGTSTECFSEIESTFADLMIHQVAMLNGVVRGVRALLAELAPAAIEKYVAEGRAKAGGMLVGPLKFKVLWRVFMERYADFAEDERQIQSLLFGAQFARAYGESRGGEDHRTRPPVRGGE